MPDTLPTHPEHSNLQVLDHPFIQHKLTWMRRKDTPTSMFRDLLREISELMGYEITREVPLRMTRIETPVAEMNAPVLAGRKPVIVSSPVFVIVTFRGFAAPMNTSPKSRVAK